MTWPDVAILGILLITTLWGFKNGLVRELGGFAALGTAIWFGATYRGGWDLTIESLSGMNHAASHAAGVAAVAIVAYTVVAICALLLRRIARLPVLSFIDRVLGAVFGAVKGVVLAWLVIYVALFFPLTPLLREDLHASALTGLLTGPNKTIDQDLKSNLPGFTRDQAQPIFKRHHV